jgi:hypothetical protein
MPRTKRDKAADFGYILAAPGQSATGEAPARLVQRAESGAEFEPDHASRPKNPLRRLLENISAHCPYADEAAESNMGAP